MSAVSRLLLLLLILVPFPGATAQTATPYQHEEVARDAARYEEYLRKSFKPDGRASAAWRSEGDKKLGANDARGAASDFAYAVVTDANDARAWLGLARALNATPPADDSDRYSLATYASGAAYLAYERASRTETKASALATLAESLKVRSYWRPALQAYKASLALADNLEIRAAYDQLVAEQGFRVLDYTVDVEALTPRLCVQFSETLPQGGNDLAKFVSIDGKDPGTVSVRDSQLCIEGFEHGKRYTVALRAGLPSTVDETLQKSADLAIYVRDRPPQARFTGRNYVLPNKGQQGIPVVSVNTKEIKLEIFRVGDRALARSIIDGEIASQVSGYQIDDLRSKTGTSVWTGVLPVKQVLNQDVTTAFPVSDALPSLKPGVYVMLAEPSGIAVEYWMQRATQWFIVSDLGLTALSGEDGVHAFVRSLETAAPTAAIDVRLVARNNDVLATGKTDARGYVRFEAGTLRGEGGSEPALLVAESGSGDYAFLDLTTGAFDLSDRGVGGRPAPGPLDAYVFTERGVYRSGERVFVTALLRDRKAMAVENLPLTIKVVRPDGVEHLAAAMPDQGLGGRATTLPLSNGAMAGTWRVRVYADPTSDPIGETSFLVEDYVPERLDLTLNSSAKMLQAGTPGTVNAEGRYLYGPPAANLGVEGEVIVEQSRSAPAGFEGYVFGLADETITPVRTALAGLPNTDANGRAALPVTLPSLPRTGHLLEAKVLMRLREPSGRAIEREVRLPVAPSGAVIGIKTVNVGNLDRGGTAEFDVVVLDSALKPIAGKALAWEIQRIERSYQWYGRNGAWNYEPVVYTTRISNGTIDVAAEKPARISAPVEWGEYRLEVTAAGPEGRASSANFSAGWYGAKTADTPEALQVALDRPSYKVGDTAKLRLVPDGAGRAMIAVLREGLLSMQEVDVPAEGTTIDLKVDETWAPGAYVTATLYRPMDVAAKRMPGRAIGIAWAGLDVSAQALGVSLDLPPSSASGMALKIPVKVSGLAPGEDARLVVAAVDVGILNLTRYTAPAPEAWYLGQRRLGTQIRDLYGRLIDGMRAERGAVRSGGDGGAGLSAGISPPKNEPVALFSGMLAVGTDGAAEATLDVPAFDGALKVMAVVWSKSKTGHAEKDVIVRDPVAMLVSGPRFLTYGDEARLLFDLHNVEAGDGTFRLAVTATADDGKVSAVLDREIALQPGERKLETIAVKADRMGLTHYAVRLTGPNGVDQSRTLALDVKAPAEDIRRTTVQTLAANTGKLTVSSDVFAGLIPGRSKVTVSVGPAAGFDVPGLLAALDRYPYGCAEQTVSRALPLLYLDEVASAAGITGEKEAETRIDAAIARLFEMQDSGGNFGVWSPGAGDLWLTAYVTDFLTRAKEQRYEVATRPFELALDRLQNAVAYAADFEKGGEDIAYALYVMARNGRAPIGDLRYYADTRIDRFATPFAKAQIGAALALYGDKERADRVFAAALAELETAAADAGRRDFGSELRDGAATLTLVSETGTQQAQSARLTELVSQSRWKRAATSTQENAWLLLAARALVEEGRALTLDVNGAATKGALMRSLTKSDLDAAPLVVANTNGVPLQAVVTVTGAATAPEAASANGFTLERSYHWLDGQPAEIGSTGKLAQNDRLVVVLKATPTDGTGGRLLLVDRLPAGLEVENPRLVDGGNVASLSWLGATSVPVHTEFRDDRFVAAFDAAQGLEGENSESQAALTVAYVVRAVSPGTFVLPAATIEDMYRPERNARTAGGTLEVTAAK